MIDLKQGDCLEVMRGMADASVTAIVTDPPYALEFMGKGWDKVLPSDEVWQEALRVLKPGGVALVFGGTRTFHRLTCSLEDAGFQVRDVLCWLYGSGFPKSLAIDKAIDKTRNEDFAPVRVVCRYLRAAMEARGLKSRHLIDHFDGCHPRLIDHWAARDTDSQPALPTCEQWLILKGVLGFDDEVDAEVWRLNGRKGTLGKDWDDRPKTGSRILSDTTKLRAGFMGEAHSGQAAADRPKREVDTTTAATSRSETWQGYGTALKPAWEPIVLAMKPLDGTFAANALEHGVAGINVDGCRIPGDVPKTTQGQAASQGTIYGADQRDQREFVPNDGGRWPANVVLDEEAGTLLDEQTGDKLHGAGAARKGSKDPRVTNREVDDYGMRQDTGKMHRFGDSGGASRFFYCAKAGKKDRGPDNRHPTVKPTSLMRWLVRMVKMPSDTVILDPFAGSGSTGVACVAESVDFIGIEREAEYVEIARRRIEGV